MKRAVDITISVCVLLATSPILLLAAVGIRLSSPGPIFYRALRVGIGGQNFSMLKFRSMHISNGGAVITVSQDPRIFRFGDLLRKLKIDELPQFFNVLRGDMSIVGPRPEDPKIVAQAYTTWMRETLAVRPGITSPGAIFYYACGEQLVDPANPEGSYIKNLLPPKLAIDRGYIERATTASDLACILRTAASILLAAVGISIKPSTRDCTAARPWMNIDNLTDMQ